MTHYVDPCGNFAIAPPVGWLIEEYHDDPRGKVCFHGPNGVDLRILASDTDCLTVANLVKFLEKRERQLGIETHVSETNFVGYSGVERWFVLDRFRAFSVDIIVGNRNHNIMYTGFEYFYQAHEKKAFSSMSTYTPFSNTQGTKADNSHLLAKIDRLVELRQPASALRIIDDVLVRNPNDRFLLSLRREILALLS